jgi:hypothetical protein
MCDHLIDALITFLATGLGVWGAFFVDNLRDKNAKQDLKKRLIRGLSHEVSELEKFINENMWLDRETDYLIEIHILEDTVRDQIDYLDNKVLIIALSDFRLLAKRINKHLELWSSNNIQSRTGASTVPERIANVLKPEWNGLRVEAIKEFKTIKGLLEKEAVG